MHSSIEYIGPNDNPRTALQSFLISVGLVALAEMGDKTQLLSLMLAARFRKPVPIILGILAATLANHAFAGAIGAWVSKMIGVTILSWILAASFVAMAIWILIPDKSDDLKETTNRFGIFGTTFIAFFFAEMGDKTQVATVALAAQYPSLFWVVAGTTVGMMIANIPAIYIGDKMSQKLPLKPIRIIASCLFLVLAVLAVLKARVG
jgi:Ca2+/H+ antiporter, TMEM165/GDT1 family